MSTVIQFECRNATNLATRSRGGLGWIPTGGVFIEQLIRGEVDDRSDDSRYVPHAILNAGPLHVAR